MPESAYSESSGRISVGAPEQGVPEFGIDRSASVRYDSYADGVGFYDGFPVGDDSGLARLRVKKAKGGTWEVVAPSGEAQTFWPVHCYGAASGPTPATAPPSTP